MSITTERKQPMTMKNPPHPGVVVLQECIEPMGSTITDAAEALGVTHNTLSELVNGRRGVSPEMAVRLSKVLGGTEQGWLVQQARYNLAHVRRDRLKLKRLVSPAEARCALLFPCGALIVWLPATRNVTPRRFSVFQFGLSPSPFRDLQARRGEGTLAAACRQ